jgi:hypothetical protein
MDPIGNRGRWTARVGPCIGVQLHRHMMGWRALFGQATEFIDLKYSYNENCCLPSDFPKCCQFVSFHQILSQTRPGRLSALCTSPACSAIDAQEIRENCACTWKHHRSTRLSLYNRLHMRTCSIEPPRDAFRVSGTFRLGR